MLVITICVYLYYNNETIITKINIMNTDITNWINRNVEIGMVGKSQYLSINNVLVRISNHLPRVSNIECYNEECEKVILVFFSSDISENDLISFIDNDLVDYDCEYILLDENKLSDYDEVLIDRFVS